MVHFDAKPSPQNFLSRKHTNINIKTENEITPWPINRCVPPKGTFYKGKVVSCIYL